MTASPADKCNQTADGKRWEKTAHNPNRAACVIRPNTEGHAEKRASKDDYRNASDQKKRSEKQPTHPCRERTLLARQAVHVLPPICHMVCWWLGIFHEREVA